MATPQEGVFGKNFEKEDKNNFLIWPDKSTIKAAEVNCQVSAQNINATYKYSWTWTSQPLCKFQAEEQNNIGIDVYISIEYFLLIAIRKENLLKQHIYKNLTLSISNINFECTYRVQEWDVDNKYIHLSNSLVILKMWEKLNAMQHNVVTPVQNGQGPESAQDFTFLLSQ